MTVDRSPPAVSGSLVVRAGLLLLLLQVGHKWSPQPDPGEEAAPERKSDAPEREEDEEKLTPAVRVWWWC